jgi:queuine tRNA-ribosyltransferase
MFRLITENNGARLGELGTSHGTVTTPVFMPVATKATVKTLTAHELENTNTQAIISNAFHLYLTTHDVITQAGGLHSFMNWHRVIFTDSGGFQIIRKDFKFKITEKGIHYTNPRDGRKHTYTPELCMEVQNTLGSDVAMTLDHCPPHDATVEEVKEAMKRTTAWARRCREAHSNRKQQLFAIIQGGTHQRLREQHVRELAEIGFDGYGIGGLSIGEPKELTHQTLAHTARLLPEDKPRYFMGVGTTIEILNAVTCGVDIFDSAYPTRNARHASITTTNGNINILRRKYREDHTPLDENCNCYTCQNHTRAYLHHLFREKELLALRLATIHNIHHLQSLMQQIQTAIKEERYQKFKEEIIKKQQ